MNPIESLFADLRAAGRKAFMPFVTAGDPDLVFTEAVIRELVNRGSSLVEVGIPYSDPIADGPVIQASYTRALDKHVRVEAILDSLGRLRGDVNAPLLTMVSYAIIYRRGLERYVTEAKAAGVAGLIVPDMLVEESDALCAMCRKHDLAFVQLITPTTPRDRAKRIIDHTTGFIYYVSVAGITGERRELPPELLDNVAWLKEQTELPICIGFGISRPEHAKLLAPVADGLIIGSAIVRRIAEVNDRGRDATLEDIGAFAEEIIGAMG